MVGKTLALALAMFAIPEGVLGADDPLIGTWSMNLARSKYTVDGSGIPPKSLVRRIEAHGNGIKVVQETVQQNGKKERFEFTAQFDEKYYPVTGTPNRDEVMYKRIDANTLETVNRKSGKETTRGRWTVSKDGKTLTTVFQGTLPNGVAVHQVQVFEKQ